MYPQKSPIVVQPHDMFDAASKSMTVASVPRLSWIRNSHVFDSFVATSQRQTAKEMKIKKTTNFTIDYLTRYLIKNSLFRD